MKNNQLTISVLPFLAALLLSASNASACECPAPESPARAFNQSDVVFSGKMIGMRPSKTSREKIQYRFQVGNVWKGPEKNGNLFIENFNQSKCSFTFDKDAKYLVYADKSEGVFSATICSRTRELSTAGEDLEFLILKLGK